MKFSFVVSLAVIALVGTARAATVPSTTGDPPVLVPWSRVGAISLGEAQAAVNRDYGAANFHLLQRWGDNTQGYFRVHGSRLVVTFYGGYVGEIGFSTGYYRTSSGFGVGSRIPLGPCHRTPIRSCEHRWRGFVYNEWNKGAPCECWVKIGSGQRSLPVTGRNFNNPWFFIYTKQGRVTDFYFALKFVD